MLPAPPFRLPRAVGRASLHAPRLPSLCQAPLELQEAVPERYLLARSTHKGGWVVMSKKKGGWVKSDHISSIFSDNVLASIF